MASRKVRRQPEDLVALTLQRGNYARVDGRKPLGLIVATPTRDGVVSDATHNCLAENMDGFTNIQCLIAGLSVDQARNALVRKINSLKESELPFDPGLVLWVDDDAWWPPGSVQRCVDYFTGQGAADRVDFVCGYFSPRERFRHPHAYSANPGEYPLPGAGLWPIYVCSFHWVMMRRNVLYRVGSDPFTRPDEGLYESEDWEFCRRARRADVRMFCATNIPIAHVEPTTGAAFLPMMPEFRMKGNELDLSVYLDRCSVPVLRSYGPTVDAAQHYWAKWREDERAIVQEILATREADTEAPDTSPPHA